uniref:Uncharacterized protein n=1 Tax=Rhizophora mucronata TaxID=61149 RepID=A0A2P2NRZ8_RHIMU
MLFSLFDLVLVLWSDLHISNSHALGKYEIIPTLFLRS